MNVERRVAVTAEEDGVARPRCFRLRGVIPSVHQFFVRPMLDGDPEGLQFIRSGTINHFRRGEPCGSWAVVVSNIYLRMIEVVFPCI